jgi:hypothetical protein
MNLSSHMRWYESFEMPNECNAVSVRILGRLNNADSNDQGWVYVFDYSIK